MKNLHRGILTGRRVLLTGHTGFKGAWMLALLDRVGAQVCGVALEEPVSSPALFGLVAQSPRRWALVQDCRFDLKDLTRLEKVFASFQPELVLHLAAQPLVRRSYQAPLETFKTNTLGTLHVLECARLHGCVKAIICATTDKVYRQSGSSRPFREDDPLGGQDPYSASKAAAEHAVEAYRESFCRERGIGLATVRAGNVIGGGDWAEDRIVPDLVRAVVRNQVACLRNPGFVRPWQHVLDALAGYLVLASRLLEDGPAFSGAWNFGADTESRRNVRELADCFFQSLGRGTWQETPDRDAPHEEETLALDSLKAQELLGWSDRWGFDLAVRRTAGWYADWMAGDDPQVLIQRDMDAYFASSPDGAEGDGA